MSSIASICCLSKQMPKDTGGGHWLDQDTGEAEV